MKQSLKDLSINDLLMVKTFPVPCLAFLLSSVRKELLDNRTLKNSPCYYIIKETIEMIYL